MLIFECSDRTICVLWISSTLRQRYIMKRQSIDGLYTNSNISSTRLVLQLSLDLSFFL